MILYILVAALFVGGDIKYIAHSDNGKTPILFKAKTDCEKVLKEADEILAPQSKETGISYQLQCVTSEQYNKAFGKEGV